MEHEFNTTRAMRNQAGRFAYKRIGLLIVSLLCVGTASAQEVAPAQAPTATPGWGPPPVATPMRHNRTVCRHRQVRTHLQRQLRVIHQPMARCAAQFPPGFRTRRWTHATTRTRPIGTSPIGRHAAANGQCGTGMDAAVSVGQIPTSGRYHP